MDTEKEVAAYNVSRETFLKLCEFSNILTEWNQKMNLVSKNTISDLWPRHILDSLQLIKYMPQNVQTLVDIGSGAGFPGVILAIALQELQPQAKVYLIESIHKKTVYLNDVCYRLGLHNVKVINERVENTVFKSVDVITARAVAALNVLFSYAHTLGNENTQMLLLKGKTYEQEEAEAQKYWQYSKICYANAYSDDGVIMQISRLRKRR